MTDVRPGRGRRMLLRLAIVMAFNVGCALTITYLLKMGSSFIVNLVFSFCIGTLAWLFIDGGRMLVWGEDKPAGLPFAAMTVLALPLAQMGGSALAAWLLGMPAHPVLATESSHAASILLFSVLAGLAATWFFWNRGKLAFLQAQAEAEKARVAGIERQAMQAQLQMLQAQVEPHMLFNTLANLQGLIATDPPRAQRLLEQLIDYLRATLKSSRAAATTLAEEFSLMDAYLGLMSIRMGERLAYRLDLPPALADVQIAPMLLQPLLENAIRHGLEPRIDGGRLDVSAVRQGSDLVLTVRDTGLGLDAPASHGTGLGLDNIRERLQALYGPGASLVLAGNQPCGTVATLTFPMPQP
nr:histidine kinase [uncultured Noviherbaspirillum sp.]